MENRVLYVDLDKESHQYSPGEYITGQVNLIMSKEEIATDISIRFFGIVETHWKERDSNDRHDSYNYFDGEDPLFNLDFRIFGDGEKIIKLPVGRSVYHFKFRVPERPLPVTCSFEDGWVLYGLEGRLNSEKTPTFPVTIVTPIDLNKVPGAGLPQRMVDNRDVGSCCRSNPLMIETFTPKAGFCPGEVIPFTLQVNNLSGKRIYNISATLTQMWTLLADHWARGQRTHTHTNPLQKCNHEGLGYGQVTNWDVAFTVPLGIPPTPGPGTCDVITLEYYIDVAFSIGECCNENNLCIIHPIVIGNVPLLPTTVVVTQQTPKYDETGGLA